MSNIPVPPRSITPPDRWINLSPGGEYVRASTIEAVWNEIPPEEQENSEPFTMIRTISGFVYTHHGDDADKILDLILGKPGKL